MTVLLAHGGPGGLALELGAVALPLVILAWFAIWNRRREQQEEAADEPAAETSA